MKKLVTLLLLTLLPFVASAYDIAVQNADGVIIYYDYTNDGTELEVTSSGYIMYQGNVVIPEEVTYMNRTRKVTSIEDKAFYDCSGLTSVTIPNSVMSIGKSAFYQCSGLKKVIVHDIAAWCKIVFSDSFSNPLYYAHHLYSDENTEIKDLLIPNSVTSIGSEAFVRCSDLTSVIIPNSVTRIGSEAFYFCSGLTSVTIPNSVTSIGDSAFRGCDKIASITIGNSVMSIGNLAFRCSGLTSIVVESGNPVYDSRDNCNAIIEIASNTLIVGCKTTHIPNSVTSIGHSAFFGCNKLTSVTIPNSVTSIGHSAFFGCNKLTSVTIPNSVTNIGELAFEGCGLTSITIPNSVTSIGNQAFDGADIPIVVSLIENPFEIIGKTSFHRTFSQNTFNNATLYVPKGTLDKYKATEGWEDFLFIVENDDEPQPYAVLSDNNTVLTFYYDNQKSARNGMDVGPFTMDEQRNVNSGWYNQWESITYAVFDESFANCNTLTSTAYWFYHLMNLSSITGISNLKTENVRDMSSMFEDCSGLTSLDLTGFKTDNVTNMGSMFSSCSCLTSLDVTSFKTDNVTDMARVFNVCSSLTSLDVSGFKTDNVTNMEYMFNFCSSLTNLDVTGFKTDDVTSMSGMFRGCSGLTSLDVRGFKTDNVTNMNGMFSGCSGLTSLDVTGFQTDNVTNMGGMFGECSSLTSLDLTRFKTDIVTDMNAMFSNCSGLTSLDVTGFKIDNVTNMGYMFRGCSGLTSLDVSGFKTDNVTNMGYMFRGCSGLTTIYAGDGWSTAKVVYGDGMFEGCTSLVGGTGTHYDESHTDHTYARIDGGASNPGYFTSKGGESPAEETEETITISSAGQTTWCSAYDLDFTGVEGLKAYTAGGYHRTKGTIWLMRVYEVPAGEGILLMGDEGEFKIPRKSTTAYYMNMFKGTLKPITINETEGEYTNYYLSNGDSGVGFYKVNGSVDLKANRAYLPLLKGTASAGTRFIGIDFGDGTTSIREVKSGEVKGEEWYTLQGQRVAKPGKGLYIHNGHKVVIK